MNDESQPTDPIDRLVKRYFRSEEERVDGEAFLRRLKERRAREAKTVRFPMRPAAAAAAFLLLLGGALLVVRQLPETPRKPAGDLLALKRCERAVRVELWAAFEGARGVGSAAFSAGSAPLAELPEVRLPNAAESVLKGFVPSENKNTPPKEKEG